MGKKPRNRLSLGASGEMPGDREEGLNLIPLEGGYELYRHKNPESMKTRNWHGFYWARQNEEGDYEIRTVPASSGEYSAPGGVWPKEGFERHYARVAR
jgi:hypothetical protein